MPVLFIEQCFNSLSSQTYKAWDLIIVNDGYEGLKSFLSNHSQLNVIVIDGKNSIVKNREIAVKYACLKGYKNIIFGDADDYFTSNRIAHTLDLLKTNDVVVNELSSVDTSGQLIVDKIFSSRLNNNQSIKKEFIRDKNVFGLSNTAVKASFLNNIVYDEQVLALDWFIFSQILSNVDIKVVFTNEILTYYRQHEMNIAGIKKKITPELIRKELRVVRLHYRALAEIDASYNELMLKTIELDEKFKNNPSKCKEYCDTINKNGIEPILWWESITL